MIEERRILDPFTTYEITSLGRVFNINTGREMTLSPTQHGELTVGLTVDGVQYRRSVKVLVARTFVPGETKIFDTPVQLDGDRTNLAADNIVWRPRWFALAYIRQFENPPDWYFYGPIQDSDGVVYENAMHAAIATGSLCEAIQQSAYNGVRVFPSGLSFIYKRA